MPDVSSDIREVYEMVTRQKPSDTGALERQRTRQIRTMRNRKVGAFAVVAAIVVAAVAVILATRPGEKPTTTGNPGDANPVEVAAGFVDSYAAFDTKQAIAFLADEADISGMIESVGAQGTPGTPKDLPLNIAWLEADGSKLTLDSCQETGSYSFGAVVRCMFDFHALGSDEIGLGPYSGSYFDLTVRDGVITHASMYWEISKFSPQMWEPFDRWVSRTYPQDAGVMYQDENHSGARLTAESIRLWERHTREYVKEVKAKAQGQ